MIKISTLRLKNFKSFKKAEIPFASGFTAIAGANASGKSNIADSLLFVFGITSLKMLRASRLSDLINHDAKEDYAKVEIDLKDKETVYNVSRIIDRRGQSVYRLGGKKKTLGEISSLLQELGIKPTGHNIVVQGDVTRVIQMNAKERRGIIDEVAGLSEFEEKKEESIRKLEQVDTRIKDATLVLNERANYLQELEREKIAAQQFNSLSQELRESKATIIFSELKRNEGEVKEVEQKIRSLEEEIARLNSAKKELSANELDAEEKIQQLTQKMIESSENTYSTIVREIEEKKAENKSLKEKLEEKQSRINYLRERIEKIKTQKENLRKEIEEKSGQAKGLANKIENDSLEWKKLKQMIDQKSGAVKSKNFESLDQKLSGLFLEAEKLQKALFEKRVVREKLSKEKEMHEKMLAFLAEEQKKTEKSLVEKKEIVSKIKALGASDPKSLISLKEKEIDGLLGHIHSLKSMASHASDSIQKLKGIDSACPVCEQKIDKQTIRKIIEQRNRHLSELHIQIEKKSQEKEKSIAEKEMLFHRLHQLNELAAKLSGFGPLEQKLQEVKAKANDAKEKIRQLSVEGIFAEENKLSASLEGILKEKSLLSERIDSARKEAGESQLNVLLSKFDELNAVKSEREKQFALLNAKINESLKEEIEGLEKEKAEMERSLEATDRTIGEDEKKIIAAGKELEAREAKMQRAMQASKVLEEEQARLKTKLSNIEQKILEAEQKAGKKEKEINELKISKSKNEIRLQDLSEEFKEFEGTQVMKNANVFELKKKLPEIEREIKKLGAINMKALDRFEELKKEVDFVKEKADKLEEERHAVLELIDKIELKKINVFMEYFVQVNKKFADLYRHFFGGEGKLSLSDPHNPTEGGLLIEAKYKDDKLKSIDAMSGGEKSLAALAFIFAIQSVEPAPFYIFDEADAALDKENSLKLAKMVREISRDSQFISITHNDSIIKEADQIIGVALNQQKSSVIGLRLKGKIEGEEKAAESHSKQI